jgi:hypothetical protein
MLYDFWLGTCTMNVSRLPTSQIIYCGTAIKPRRTHTSQKRGQKEHGREPDSNEIGLCPLHRDGSARPSPFSSATTGLSSIRGSSSLSAFIYIQAPSIGCHVGWVGYTESLSSFFSEREMYIFTESCRLLTDRRTNPEHKPD